MSKELHFCLYFKNNEAKVGLIVEETGKRFRVVNERGDRFQLNAKQCEMDWRETAESVSGDVAEVVARKRNELEEKSSGFDCAEARQICDEGEAVSLEDICGLFLDSPWKKSDEVSVYLALRNDLLHFRRKKNDYFPRPADEIERLRKEGERQREAQAKEDREREWASSIRAERKPEIQSGEEEAFRRFLQRTRLFAVYQRKNPEAAYLCRVWNLSPDDEHLARARLSRALAFMGFEVSWGGLLTASTEQAKPFPPEALAEAASLIARPEPENGADPFTVDETRLHTFTVDSEATEDYDDAISLEKTERGYAIRLHVTDVAGFVPPGSSLFEQARLRIATLYTLKRNFHMFPRELALGVFSLKENRKRAVLTFRWDTDGEGNAIDLKIYRSLVLCNENLTYEEIDARLEKGGSPDLEFLAGFCRRRFEERLKAGALFTRRKDLKIDVSDPDAVKIREVLQDGPSHLIVSELAIQANAETGRLCGEHGLGGIFRVQEPYVLTRETPQGEPVDLNHVILKAARVAAFPGRHSGLGVEAYVQCTSPIRRFTDLIAQHLLSGWIRGTGFRFPPAALQMWSRDCEDAFKECSKIERELNYHWKLKYLEQNSDREFEASFVRYLRGNFALVSIDEVQMFKEVNHPGFYEGCRFRVRVKGSRRRPAPLQRRDRSRFF